MDRLQFRSKNQNNFSVIFVLSGLPKFLNTSLSIGTTKLDCIIWRWVDTHKILALGLELNQEIPFSPSKMPIRFAHQNAVKISTKTLQKSNFQNLQQVLNTISPPNFAT